MEKKELLEKLIAHYEESIELVKGETDLEKVENELDLRQVDFGVCCCALLLFKVNPNDLEWVKKYLNGQSGYWCSRPASATSIPEAISLLQVRVDIMRKELENE
jgi:hypothetical protein